MADISALGNLQAAEPLDMAQYKDANEPSPLPKKGRYTVKAPDTFPSTAFGSTKAGFLSAQIDPTIVGPTNENYTLRFTKVSAKTFKRGGLTASQLGDYVRACGRRGNVGSDPQAQADAVEQTAGLTYQIDADWRAYCKGCGTQIEGEKEFPTNGKDGSHVPFAPCPNCKDAETGEPVQLRANLYVSRFVSAI